MVCYKTIQSQSYLVSCLMMLIMYSLLFLPFFLVLSTKPEKKRPPAHTKPKTTNNFMLVKNALVFSGA